MKTGMFCFEINAGSDLGLFSQYERARKLFKAGKKREGYQTTQDILDQSTHAMNILNKDYSDEKHVLAYDNATIHTARAPDALSTVSMTAKPSVNFNKVKGPDDVARCVTMRDATFRDGTPQSLYFPDGRFKGMKILISERCAKGHDPQTPMLQHHTRTPERKSKLSVATALNAATPHRSTVV
jgi:hypothetical protein